jgi:hypothetical protein
LRPGSSHPPSYYAVLLSPDFRAFFLPANHQHPALSGLILTRSVPIPVPTPSSFLSRLRCRVCCKIFPFRVLMSRYFYNRHDSSRQIKNKDIQLGAWCKLFSKNFNRAEKGAVQNRYPFRSTHAKIVFVLMRASEHAHFQSKFFSKNKFEFFLARILPDGIASQHDGVIEPIVIDQSLKDHFALIERPLSANKIFHHRIKQNKKTAQGRCHEKIYPRRL